MTITHRLALAFALVTAATPALASDEDDIKKAAAAMDAAWGKGDAKAILALHTEDALVVNPAGIGAKGKKEMAELLGKVTHGPGKATPKTTVTSVRQASKDVAIVDADLEGTGPDGKPTIAKRLMVMVKKDGKWLVSDSRAYFLVQPPPVSASAPKK